MPTPFAFPGRSGIPAPFPRYISVCYAGLLMCCVYNQYWWRAGLWWFCSYQLELDSCSALSLYHYEIRSSWIWTLPRLPQWAEFTETTRWQHSFSLWRFGEASNIINTHTLHNYLEGNMSEKIIQRSNGNEILILPLKDEKRASKYLYI